MKSKLLAIFKKQLALNLVPKAHIPQWNDQAVAPKSLNRYAVEGYQKNVIVYRAITLIAKSLASVPFVVDVGGERMAKHPLTELLLRANPHQSRATFFEAIASYYLLTGNAFIEMVKDDEGRPAELYVLRPDRVEIIPHKTGGVKAYRLKVDGQERTIPANGERGALLHLKTFHPTQEWYGMSPLDAAGLAIDQHNTVSSHNLALLNNGGRPTGALMVKTGAYGLSDAQRQLLKEDVDRLYKGTQNAGRLVMLEGDFEWKEMGLSPKDMDFIEGKHQSAREIAQAFGVPPMLVGVPGDATFANYREARYHLWEDTILPLLDHFLAEMTLWLDGYFGAGATLSYDLDGIPALSLKREATWQKISAAPFLTVNEKRQLLGFPRLEKRNPKPVQAEKAL